MSAPFTLNVLSQPAAKIGRERLLPPSVAAAIRKIAAEFLKLSSRDKLLLVAVANGNTPTESGDIIAATIEEIEALLAKGEADQEADLAAVAAYAGKRLGPFASLLAQIDPARRGIFTTYSDGSTDYKPTDAATAHSTPCLKAANFQKKKPGRKANAYNAGLVVIETRTDKPKTLNRHLAHEIQCCHNCRNGKGEWCIKCQRASHDDIRIKRTPKNINPELAESPAPAEPGADAPQATNLPPEIENALRIFLATFAALPPLAVLHVAHKATRNTDTFAQFIRQFAETMNSHETDKQSTFQHRFIRGTLTLAWTSISRRYPPFAVFRTWDKGHFKKTADTNGGDVRADESEATAEDGTFDRAEPFAADRDEDTTRYFFEDGSGTEL